MPPSEITGNFTLSQTPFDQCFHHRWVEQGIAPQQIVATKYVNDDSKQGVARTRPLCLYPQVARYKGTGSTDDAANFACATSAK